MSFRLKLVLVTVLYQFCINVSEMCDFEKDLCGYTQDKTDTFDWTRYRRSTSSAGTGPTADHTKGTTAGWLKYSLHTKL